MEERILAYMAGHITLTLATTHGGQPRATTLFYASSGFDLYFLSSPSTEHAQHMLANPSVFVTISQDYADWQGIQGIQLRGRAQLLSSDSRAREVYIGKFPFVATFPSSAMAYWQVTPSWVRMIDNTIAFAHKDELDLSGVPRQEFSPEEPDEPED